MIESYWAGMQTELLNCKKWRTRIELVNTMFEYLDLSTTANGVTLPSGCGHPQSSHTATQTAQPVA